jgi:hypothetical protein
VRCKWRSWESLPNGFDGCCLKWENLANKRRIKPWYLVFSKRLLVAQRKGEGIILFVFGHLTFYSESETKYGFRGLHLESIQERREVPSKGT